MGLGLGGKVQPGYPGGGNWIVMCARDARYSMLDALCSYFVLVFDVTLERHLKPDN